MKLFLLLTFILLLTCHKDEPIILCLEDVSSFIYKGPEEKDSILWEANESFIWDSASLREGQVNIRSYRQFSGPISSFIFSELLSIKVPPKKGTISQVHWPIAGYGHVFEDLLGDNYNIDSTQLNHLEVICADTIAQHICVSFDLHFIRNEEPSYPWPEKVSFTEGLYCGHYSE